ncbi:MAG TPA: hypothetical protein VGG41_09655 [Solirubrobacteraceae bacterium]|jgi:hypothetical protein
MSRRVRHASSLLALGAIATIAILFVGGLSHATGAAAPCAARTITTYRAAALSVARHIAGGERGGTAVERALKTIESDRVLAAALAAGDSAAVHAQMLVLLYNHEHIVRIRVLRGGRLVDDVGGPFVLAPVRGLLRQGGRVVGSFLMSIQDDMGYRLLLARLAGVHSVITYNGQTVMRDLTVGPRQLGAASVRVGTTRYLVASLRIGRFPSGTLRVYVLLAAPPASMAHVPCDQVRADELAGVARNAYEEALGGQQIARALHTIARAATLRAALATGDYATADQVIRSLVRSGGFARLRVFARGHLVAEAGSSRELIAPVSRPLRDDAGKVYGRALFTAQSAHGYADLAHFLTGEPVLVRSGRLQLAGTFAGPPSLPRSGALDYGGVSYRVASFAGERFPSGPLRVYVLIPTRS